MARPKRAARLSEEEARYSQEIRSHVGSRIRELREMQGLTLTALAEFVRIDFHRLSKIERGKVNISIETADRIARGVGVHTWELFVPRERSEVMAIDSSRKGRAAKDRHGS